jgi:hypothetical protein
MSGSPPQAAARRCAMAAPGTRTGGLPQPRTDVRAVNINQCAHAIASTLQNMRCVGVHWSANCTKVAAILFVLQM